MILFCEDCGAKNQVTDSQLVRGKACFKCSSCAYGNDFALTSFPRQGVKQNFTEVSSVLLRTLVEIPDIIGTFAFHAQQGIIKRNMPQSLKTEDLQILGKVLGQCFSQCRSSISDLEGMSLFITNRNLALLPAGDDLFIVAVCRTARAAEMTLEGGRKSLERHRQRDLS